MIHVFYCDISAYSSRTLAHLHVLFVQFNHCLVQVCECVLQVQRSLIEATKVVESEPKEFWRLLQQFGRRFRFYQLNQMLQLEQIMQ